MVGKNEERSRFNVSPIYLTYDNTVNTIPAGSPERSTLCSRFLCLANAASSPDQCYAPSPVLAPLETV